MQRSALQYRKGSSKTGFTLIEILVVMAIIGLLATIILGSFSNARKKSRDARRVADLKQLENAIHLYVSISNGLSPVALSNLTTGGSCGTSPCIVGIPVDPSGGTNAYGYVQLASGGYVLGTVLETPGQVGPLLADYDASQVININGNNTDNCNGLAGADAGTGATEKIYCIYSP